MPAFTKPRLTRRALLAGASGVAALAAGGGLSGCSSKTDAKANTAAKNESVKVPAYVPYKGVTPDLPGTKQGVQDAFRHWPKENPKSVEDKPGTGKESITGFANIYYAIPPGPPKNTFWAGLNKRLGVDLKLQMVPNADFDQKFATAIAGGSLPDVMEMRVVANFPSLLEKEFAPLDDYIGGDAIKDYPNLANLPTDAWNDGIYNGHIYGIPIPRAVIGHYNFIRQDIFEAKGLSPDPKGYDELMSTAKALTNPKKRVWAFGTVGQPQTLLASMNGEPNGWRNDGGKLTNAYETDEYKQSITDLIAMWKSGVIHPNAFDTSQPFKQLFNSGTCAINAGDGYAGWTQYTQDNASNPKFKLGLMKEYNRDGSALAHWHYGTGRFYEFNALKKQSDPNKIKLILRVLNWLAAPFGTEEYLYATYGQEGVDHKINSHGDPVLTKTGQNNTVIPIRYLAGPPTVIYQPGRPQDADTMHKYESAEVPTGIKDPTNGLFSNTSATKNATISKNFTDGINQIIQGRQPISELDSLLKAWRSGGGDQIRNEYQEQLQKNGGS
jgi:putative aldouronate transport system substrate-binding protein